MSEEVTISDHSCALRVRSSASYGDNIVDEPAFSQHGCRKSDFLHVNADLERRIRGLSAIQGIAVPVVTGTQPFVRWMMAPNDDLFPGTEASAERMRLRSRTVPLPDGRRLRIRLETSFWEGIDEILDREGLRLPELIVMMERMAGASPSEPMAPRLRHLVIQYFHEAATRTRGTDAPTDSAEVIPFDTFRRRRGKN